MILDAKQSPQGTLKGRVSNSAHIFIFIHDIRPEGESGLILGFYHFMILYKKQKTNIMMKGRISNCF